MVSLSSIGHASMPNMVTKFIPARADAATVMLAVDFYPEDAPRDVAWIFVHGFGSGRDGDKARALATAATERGYLFVTFDQQGHGDSGGGFEKITVQRSLDDLRTVLKEPAIKAAKHRVVIGSSFGALVACWAALTNPDQIDALLLIAPAFGFLERIVATLDEQERERWQAGGLIRIQNQWIDQAIESRILDDRLAHTEARLPQELQQPTVVLHGRGDEIVPYEHSVRFFEQHLGSQVELRLFADGDHRLQRYQTEIIEAALKLSLCNEPSQPTERMD